MFSGLNFCSIIVKVVEMQKLDSLKSTQNRHMVSQKQSALQRQKTEVTDPGPVVYRDTEMTSLTRKG